MLPNAFIAVASSFAVSRAVEAFSSQRQAELFEEWSFPIALTIGIRNFCVVGKGKPIFQIYLTVWVGNVSGVSCYGED